MGMKGRYGATVVHVFREVLSGLTVCAAGLAALILSCWSRCTAARDWDGAELKGRLAMYLSIAGIIISIVVLVVAVLFLFTKDT